jgi:hypothetical protein
MIDFIVADSFRDVVQEISAPQNDEARMTNDEVSNGASRSVGENVEDAEVVAAEGASASESDSQNSQNGPMPPQPARPGSDGALDWEFPFLAGSARA